MRLADRLALGLRRPPVVVLQTEAAECGLACLAMVAAAHGDAADMAALRRRFGLSLKGATLAQLMRIAEAMRLATRAVKLELPALGQLRLPCVLHWNFNHFVVLQAVAPDGGATLLDPATGLRAVSARELSDGFTGVALELWPQPDFVPRPPPPRLRLRQLLGPVRGLRRALAQLLLLSLALEVFTLASPFLMQAVLDHVIPTQDTDLLTLLAIGFGALLLMQQATTAARAWVLMAAGSTLNLQWRAGVFSHLLRLPPVYFERRHLGDVVSRFGAIDAIQRTLTTSFVGALLDGLMTVLTLGMMLLYSPALAGVCAGAALAYLAIRWAWYRPLRRATEAELVHAARQQTHFLETVRGVKAIQRFGRHEERRAAWLALLVEQINAGLHSQKLQLLYQQLQGLLAGVEQLAIVWWGTRMVLDGPFTVGALMAFLAYKAQFAGRAAALIDKGFEYAMLRLQGERLADIVLTPAQDAPASPTPAAPGAAASVEWRGVRLRFAEHEPEVLAGVDLRVGAGESVAIVGPSGSGKTTLVNLLLGALEPTAGEILVDGRPLGELGLDALRARTAAVMQDDVLFAGSLSDNIAFLDPQPDAAWIEGCARLAGVHDEIQAMPMRYDTLVGDMGSVLSGGQRQRVLLARALYRRPGILVLDEATSHLDVAKEREVNAAVRSLPLTRIVVAHRPETIASADRVVVLQGGRIVADGPAPAPDRAAVRAPAATPRADDRRPAASR